MSGQSLLLRLNRHIVTSFISLFFVLFGVICILLFNEDIYLSILVSASFLILSAFSVLTLYRQSQVGILTMLLFVVYLLPFIHVFPYIWFDFDSESPSLLWGGAVNPYMIDKNIIELMSMMGAVGAAGFVVGASLFQEKLPIDMSTEVIVRYRSSEKTLSIPVFLIWVALAIIFTWISAPADTVFTAAYAESMAIYDEWNFSSAKVFSYAFLLFTLGDSMFEMSPKIRDFKRNIFIFSLIIIVIWFQLLRGDREILTCILAAGLMYYVWGKDISFLADGKIRRNWSIILLLALFVFVAAYIVGILRPLLVDMGGVNDFINVLKILVESGALRIDNLISGTWSGALLTPLSVAGDYINGSLSIKHGQTYIDLIISTIPGFLADLIGYVRPIDAMHGPASEMTYGQGGIHAVVVPFINFKMTGIFIIIACWSFIFTKVERCLTKNINVINISLLGIIAMAIPYWFWYGEKNIINALIIWFLLSILYKVRLPNRISTLHSSGHAQRFN